MKSPRQPGHWQWMVILSGLIVTLLFSLIFIFSPYFLSLVGLQVVSRREI